MKPSHTACVTVVQQQRAEYISTGGLSFRRELCLTPCCAPVETQPSHNQHTILVRIQWNMTDNSTLYHNCLWRWCFRGFLAGFIYEHSTAAVFPWWQKTYTPLILQFCIYSAAIMPSETVNTGTLRAPGLLGSFLHDEQNKNEIQLQFNASSAVSSVR